MAGRARKSLLMAPAGTIRRVAVRRAPLAGAAAALAAGIAAGRFLPLDTGFYAVCVAALLAAAALSAFRRHLHAITCACVAATIFALGAVHARLDYLTADENHIVTYTGDRSILATLRGVIVTSPMRFRQSASLGYRRPDLTGFVLEARKVRARDGWRDVSGLVRVTIQEPADHLAAGQQVELLGRMGRFRRPPNPGQYDQAAAARRNHTLVRMTVPAAEGATVVGGADRPWYARLYWNVRASARQHLGRLGTDADGRLLNALIIGERHPALDRLNRAMIRCGIAHFLSISGLHLGVFLGFVYLLCRLCALSPRRSATLVLGVLGAYVLLAEPRVPLLRSAIMAAFLCIATICRRRHSAPNALAAAAIVLLVIDPLQLFAPGFQLSFAIVAGIICLHGPVRRGLFGRWLRRRGLVVFRTDQRLSRYVRFTLLNRLMDGAAIALVAYAAAAPLVAYHFDLFSPYAAPLSVLLFPLVVAVLVPGYVSMALLWPLPGLSYAIGRAASGAASLLGRAVQAVNVLPGVSFELRPLPAAWVLGCYAALGLVVFARRLPLGRIWAAAAIAALCVWTAAAQLPASAPPTAELHLLAVGSGQCALLRTPGGQTVLLDAGTLRSYDAYRQVIAPFLRDRRLPCPRRVFVSHANTDHFNALGGLIDSGKLERIYLNDYFAAGPPSPSIEEAAETKFMRSLLDADVEVVRLREGEVVVLDDRTSVEVVWPPQQRRDDLSVNDTSLVLRIKCDGQSVLLTSDLDETGQRALAAAPRAVAADVLVLPHHGGWEPSLPGFFDAVDPGVVLVSNARPLGETVGDEPRRAGFYARIRTTRRYYSTSRNGWIRLRFGRGRIDVKTMW